MDTHQRIGAWPDDSVARVPYWVYQDEANYRRELERLFEGPTWNFVCLEADIPEKGDYRTNVVGAMPVIVVRDVNGAINCFENRCAHRGALIAFDDGGKVENQFKCIYHAWSYDLCGNLRGIAFEKGINGVGGMPKDFQRDRYGPRKLRTTTLGGMVFATLSDETPPIEQYLGAEILGRVKRVLNRPIKVMGRFVQVLPNNWKLYVENVKDTYHASLLHLFFGTFRITRLTQGGGVLVSPDGGHHATSAALEFAVLSLGVSHVVVMGHGRCGGIRAVIQPAGPLTHTDFIGNWMRAIKDVTRIVPREEGCDDALHERHIERASIEHSLANLRTFPWIRMKENRKELSLHGVWFDISLGELHAYDEDVAEWDAVKGERAAV